MTSSAMNATLNPKRQANFTGSYCSISKDPAPATHHNTSQGKGDGESNSQQNQTETSAAAVWVDRPGLQK